MILYILLWRTGSEFPVTHIFPPLRQFQHQFCRCAVSLALNSRVLVVGDEVHTLYISSVYLVKCTFAMVIFTMILGL